MQDLPLRDRELKCIDCGTPFVWTAGEQQYFAARDLAAPKRCRPCRCTRRAEQPESRARV